MDSRIGKNISGIAGGDFQHPALAFASSRVRKGGRRWRALRGRRIASAICFGALAILAFPQSAAAVDVWTESFETDGQTVRYTATMPFNDGANDYWDRGGNADFSTLTDYLLPDGSSFWAAEDVNGPAGNGNAVQRIDFAQLNIAGHTNLQFLGLFAATQQTFGPGFPFQNDEHLKVLYSIDSGPYQNAVWFTPNANKHLALDTNFDGAGDSTELAATFVEFSSVAIPDGSTLDLRVEVKADSASEEVALDLFKITGDVVAGNPAPTVAASSAANVGEAGIGDTAYSFTVTYSDNSAVDVSTIGVGNVTVTGPGGLLTVTAATEPTGTDGAPKTATYTVTPPGGSWDAADNGFYDIDMVASQVGDDGGPQLFVAAGAIAFFNVNATNTAPFVSTFLAEDVIYPDFGSTSYQFTIEYSDGGAIDVSSIDASDVTVTGPGGAVTVVSGVEATGVDGSPKTATYTVTPPGGSWDAGDVGTYTVELVGSQVLDAVGISVPADPSLTTFKVLSNKLLNESFETDGQGVRYTASMPFNDGADDYWDRGENAGFSTLTDYLLPDGTHFWAAEDTNATPEGNGAAVQTLDFGPINIAGHYNLRFSGLFAATGNTLGGALPFTADEHIKVQYQIDGGGFQNGLWFTPTAGNKLAKDANFDGTGDGSELAATFGTFLFDIFPNGATLDLRIEVKADGSSEEIAFDNLMLTGTPFSGNLAPSVAGSSASDVGETEIGDASYSFTVTYSDDSAVDVSTIDVGDITVTGPGGALTVTNATEPTGTNGAPRTVTYTVTPPGGTWDAADNGLYTTAMNASELGDDGGPQLFVAAGTITPFVVNATNTPPVVSNFLAEDVIYPDFGSTAYNFTVEYSDVGGVDVSSIDVNDVTVTGPGGTLTVTGVSVNPAGDGSPRTATYTVTPPGGAWNAGDVGVYTIGIVGNEVLDVLGASAPADPTLTTFDVLPDKLLNESFETDGQGPRYTASTPFNDGANDYWDRGQNADFDTLTPYLGSAGPHFWAAEDTNSPAGNGAAVQTMDFTVDISSHTNLEFVGLFASTGYTLGSNVPFGTDEYVRVSYQIDGGLVRNGVWFAPNGNNHLAQDLDFDGIGDLGATELTDTFVEFSSPITGIGSTLNLRVEVKADSSSEEVAFDSIRVCGELPPNGSIQGQKFEDINANGVLDPGEPGLNGWTIDLVGTSDAAITVTLTVDTDGSGLYSFEDVPPGLYTISEAQQAGWTQSAPAGGSHTVQLLGGQIIDGLYFGNYVPGSIHGFKFEDLDADGVHDASEPPSAGISFELTGTDGQGNAVGPIVEQTDANGEFWYTGLTPGHYWVREMTELLPSGVLPSTHTDFHVTVQSREEYVWQDGAAMLPPNDPRQEVNVGAELMFGNFSTGSIHGLKFEDLNANGVRDPGEPGLPGWTINLVDATGGVVQTVTTMADNPATVPDESGMYWIPNLTPGQYTVTETLQAGWTQSAPASGNHPVLLQSGQVIEGLDFGNFVPGSIHGLKFEDVDANGVYESAGGDAPSAGIAFELTGIDENGNPVGQLVTGTTNANGEFSFEGLRPGDYVMREVVESLPPGVVPTTTTTFEVTIQSREEYVWQAGAAHLPAGDPRREVVVGAALMFGNGRFDFGDAPDPTYPTLSASNGARHALGGPLFMGLSVDADPNGQPTATANGDDMAGATPDDEDGVVFTKMLYVGQTGFVDVTVTGAGLLNAWIDFDGNGSWLDAGEQVFADEALAAGSNSLTFAIPASAAIGDTFARFRFNSAGGLAPTGQAVDGEVEDYAVEVKPAADLEVSKTVDHSGPPVPGTITYCIDILNRGPSDANGVLVDDYMTSGLYFLSANATAGSFDNVTGIWTVGGLAAGTSATLKITAQILPGPGDPGSTGAFIDVFVGSGSGGLTIPRSLTFGPDGNLYVTSLSTHEVLRYDGATGAFIDDFVGAFSGGLLSPTDSSFGPDGNLYVSSLFSHEVLRYDGASGAFIDAFVSAGLGGLLSPSHLTFGPNGDLHVASEATNEVLKYDAATGAFLGAFVAAGSGGLADPASLTFGPDGQLYVCSSSTNEVLRYDGVTGAFVDVFVPSGSGGLANPLDILFGPDNQLYVSSKATNEILRYDGASGAFNGAYANVTSPLGMVFGPDGHLYVGKKGPHDILRFDGHLTNFAAVLAADEHDPNMTNNSDSAACPDRTPPTVSITASPNILWPPNHDLRRVTCTIVATDDTDPNPLVELISLESNEPDDAPGGGDGDTVNDMQAADGDLTSDDTMFLLRAERAGSGQGRIYTITYRITDSCGNSVEESCTVRVPKSSRRR